MTLSDVTELLEELEDPPDPDSAAVAVEADPEVAVAVDEPVELPTNGLVSALMTASVRSKVNWLWASCWVMVADWLVLSRAEPCFQDEIQGDEEDVGVSLQLLHLTFAIICPPITPDPANSSTVIEPS